MERGTTPGRWYFACALLGLAGCATARHDAPPEVATQPQQATAQQRLDAAHDRVYTEVQSVIETTDRRLAGKDVELKPVPVAPFRIGTMVESIHRKDGNDLGLDLNLDILLSLPNIEQRLHVFITSNELDEAPRSALDSSSLRAGLRYALQKHIDFDLGIRFDAAPVAFTAVRWASEFKLGEWNFYPFAKLFAETKESFGYAAATTFDHWSDRNLLRSSTYAKWRHDLSATEWSQSFVYAHVNQRIAPDRYGGYLQANDIGDGWGVRLLASGEKTSGVSYYETAVFYRHPTSNRWLFWYVEPLVQWNRQYAWHADPGLRIGINALFWDLARPAR